MAHPSNRPDPAEPDDQEIEKAIADEREEKYGGRERWFLTICFLGLLPALWWTIHAKDNRAIFIVAVEILAGVWGALNWRSWLKKTPAQRAAQPASNPLSAFSAPTIVFPCKKSDFIAARSIFPLYMLLFLIPFMFAALVTASFVFPHQVRSLGSFGVIFAIICGVISWFFGSRAVRALNSLACPGCRDALISQGNYVLETGHCHKCGRQVISDIVAPAHPHVGGHHPAHNRLFPSRNFQHDPHRLIHVIILLSCPAIAAYWFEWNRLDPALSKLFAILLLSVGAVLYLFPEKELKEESVPAGPAPASPAAKTDFGILLLLPIVLAAGLLYLVWNHTVLNLLGLIAVTVLVPATIFLVSYFVARHAAYVFKKTNRHATMRLFWVMIGFWAAATFLFVICLVSLIQKYGLKW